MLAISVVVVAALCCYGFEVAVEIVYCAACFLVIAAFKLDGGMTDMIFFAEHGGKGLQNGRTATRRQIIDECVAGECIHAASDAPDMEIVDILYAFNAFHIIDKMGE